jgi:hypothetical protein
MKVTFSKNVSGGSIAQQKIAASCPGFHVTYILNSSFQQRFSLCDIMELYHFENSMSVLPNQNICPHFVA